MNPITHTIQKVQKTILRHGMIDHGDCIVVGVSGGPDSVCLLDILYHLIEEHEIRLIVAHYNHGLRKMEDESETRFVKNLAGSMNLRFYAGKTSLLNKRTASIEEKAREERYQFLESVKEQFHAQKIAVGHNLNDQAETVLMRLLRGSGPSGLSGIPPIREDVIIRPLIQINRQEIETYLKARGMPYVLDSSNTNTNYLRNRLRLELLPRLLDYQPLLIEHLGQLSTILRHDDHFLQTHAVDWLNKTLQQGPDGDISIPIPPFLILPRPIKSRIVRHLIKKIGSSLKNINHIHIQAICQLAESAKPHTVLNLPNNRVVKKIYDRLFFTLGTTTKPLSFEYVIKKPGSFFLEPLNRTITIEPESKHIRPGADSSKWTVYLDADKIKYPLRVRTFRPGDRFIPLGMKGHKKIKDFFIDQKIPIAARTSTPLLISQDGVLWVCGYRIDERFKVTPQTKNILKVMIH